MFHVFSSGFTMCSVGWHMFSAGFPMLPLEVLHEHGIRIMYKESEPLKGGNREVKQI